MSTAGAWSPPAPGPPARADRDRPPPCRRPDRPDPPTAARGSGLDAARIIISVSVRQPACRVYAHDNVTACRDNCPCHYSPFPKLRASLACRVARSSAASNQAAYRPRQPRQASVPSTPPNCCGSSVRCDTRPATRPRQCHGLSRQMTRPMTP